MSANTGFLNTSFNSSPYWDDFDAENNYVRILHKGGVADQIREQTQSFTIQQFQNKTMNDHILVDGSLVKGGEFNIDTSLEFVKIKDTNNFANTVILENFKNTEITGSVSGLKAIVVNISEGSESTLPNTKTLHIKYQNNSDTTSTFLADEILTANNSFTAIVTPTNTTPIGSSSEFTINEGVIYAKGFPVRFKESKLILDKYTNSPSYRVGFNVEEIIVTAGDTLTKTTDPSLFDHNNNRAPGADRLKLDPTLVKYTLDETTSPDFVELFTIKDGVIQTKNDRPVYADIKNELARRTYDESGDYIVNGLNTIISDHLNNGTNDGYKLLSDGGEVNSFDVSISPGTGVIKGYDFNILVSQHLKTDKGIDFIDLEQQIVSSNYGNYVLVDEVSGYWDNGGGFIDLYDSPQNSITSGNYSTVTPSGNIIGKARVRSIQYHSSGQHKLYIYDIKMVSGEFSSVQGIYLNNIVKSSGFADPVLENGKAVIKDTGFTSSIIQIPSSGIRRIRNNLGVINNSFNFQKEYDVTIAPDGTFTVDTGNPSHIFPFGLGSLNSTQIQDNFYLVTNVAGGGLNKGEFIDLSVNSRTVTVNSPTTITVDTNLTLGVSVSATIICEIQQIDGKESLKLLKKNRYVVLDTTTHPNGINGPWNLGISDVIKINSIAIGGIDKTKSFILDNGQRDGMYDHAKLIKSGVVPSGQIVVNLDYFSHDTSQGSTYLSIDSYPVDDTGVTPDTIKTYEIPIYKSPTSGKNYDLRNCIDCRPSRHNVSIDSIIISSATVNPVSSSVETLNYGIDGLKYITPNSQFTMDLSYYLKRKDLVVMDKEGNFDIVRGIPSLSPITPKVPPSTMSLSTINISPYPSLPNKFAIKVGRYDLSTRILRSGIRRYTMENIGTLDQRISNLEYEASLNKLEKETKDLKILDQNGLDRFKNGIIVDNFTGHKVGDVLNPDYKISIDPRNQELRPPFNLDDIGIKFKSGTNIARKPKDNYITVLSSAGFTVGEIVYQGVDFNTSTGFGTIVYIVDNKLLVEDIVGSFAEAIDLKGVSSNSISNVSTVEILKDGPLITLPYKHNEYSGQNYASATRNAAGLFWSWKGIAEIFPKSDFWTDTTEVAPVNINFDGNLDAWEQLTDRSWNTEFGDWRTRWTGQATLTGTTVTNQASGPIMPWITRTTTNTFNTLTTRDREVTSLSPILSEETQTIENNVIDVSISPLLRPRPIFFKLLGMKPETKIYTFFDGEDVTNNILPLTSTEFNYLDLQSLGSNFLPINFNTAGITSLIGDALNTNIDGEGYGVIFIPEGKFINGMKVIRFSDNQFNSTETGQYTTSADTSYTSSGLNKVTQDTIISTQTVELREISSIETETINVASSSSTSITFSADPIAQSFKVDTGSSGIFLSKIDLFFQTKDPTLPVTIEIREMYNNQVVTNKIIPYSKTTLYPNDINTSIDGTTPTTFYFESPVFLQNGYDYAFVILPAASNPNYNVWIAELGGTDISSGTSIIQQPNSGVLFASSNNGVWQPIQTEDIKYKLYQCEFDTTITGNVLLENEDIDYFEVENPSAKFSTFGEEIYGPVEFDITSVVNGSFIIGDIISGSTSGATGTVVSLPTGKLRVSITGTTQFTDGEQITSTTTVSATISNIITTSGNLSYYDNSQKMQISNSKGNWGVGDIITGRISGNTTTIKTLDYKHINLINPQISNITFPNTILSGKSRTVNSLSFNKTPWFDINLNSDNDLSKEMVIRSTSQENNIKSLDYSLTMTTGDKNVSPVVDLSRSHTILVGNIVNNDSTGETDPHGGNALARYITKKVQLAEGQDAEDFKLYLTGYRPSGTSIKPYIKLLNGEDSDIFDDRSWVELEGSPINIFSDISSQDFVELEYHLPDNVLTGGIDGVVQYTNTNNVTFTGYKYFALKIVLLSPNTSLIPKCKEGFRGICLQK